MNKILLIFLQVMVLTLVFANSTFAIVEDELVNSTLSAEYVEKPSTNLNYNYEDTDIVNINLAVLEDIKSEKYLQEGQIIPLHIVRDVKYKGQTIIKYGTPASARVEMIITNGMNGIPASVVLGDFKISGVPQSKISDSYEKHGLDLSLLVFPLKWALTILPPTGSFTNFIKGGHVKFKANDVFSIQYHPNWN